MTLRMADGPVANLPTGMDAYAGYTDNSGIGVTFPNVLARFPSAQHLSISVHGQAAAMCGDVENGALGSWAGYTYGYGEVSKVGIYIKAFGRPKKLWVAHYTDSAHICTSAQCWPDSPVAWVADGTQWTTHNNSYDESLLAADFFQLTPPSPPPAPQPTGDEVTPADLQTIETAIDNAVNHALTLILYGDSQAAAQGKAVQGHPFNLAEIYADVQAIKAKLGA